MWISWRNWIKTTSAEVSLRSRLPYQILLCWRECPGAVCSHYSAKWLEDTDRAAKRPSQNTDTRSSSCGMAVMRGRGKAKKRVQERSMTLPSSSHLCLRIRADHLGTHRGQPWVTSTEMLLISLTLFWRRCDHYGPVSSGRRKSVWGRETRRIRRPARNPCRHLSSVRHCWWEYLDKNVNVGLGSWRSHGGNENLCTHACFFHQVSPSWGQGATGYHAKLLTTVEEAFPVGTMGSSFFGRLEASWKLWFGFIRVLDSDICSSQPLSLEEGFWARHLSIYRGEAYKKGRIVAETEIFWI